MSISKNLPFVLACGVTVLAFVWVLVVVQRSHKATEVNREIGKVNQAYNRATNCFAAVSPTRRTPDHVKDCYDKAEAAAGVKIDRYGDGR